MGTYLKTIIENTQMS